MYYSKDIELIELYGTVCCYYDSILAAQAQRMGNNGIPLSRMPNA
jgi:hypothetical protein